MTDFRCVFVVYTGLCLKYHMDSRNTNFKVSYSASFFFSEALSWDSQVWQLWMKTRLFVEQVSRHYTSDVFVWTRSAMLVCFLQAKHLVSLGMFFEKKKKRHEKWEYHCTIIAKRTSSTTVLSGVSAQATAKWKRPLLFGTGFPVHQRSCLAWTTEKHKKSSLVMFWWNGSQPSGEEEKEEAQRRPKLVFGVEGESCIRSFFHSKDRRCHPSETPGNSSVKSSNLVSSQA